MRNKGLAAIILASVLLSTACSTGTATKNTSNSSSEETGVIHIVEDSSSEASTPTATKATDPTYSFKMSDIKTHGYTNPDDNKLKLSANYITGTDPSIVYNTDVITGVADISDCYTSKITDVPRSYLLIKNNSDKTLKITAVSCDFSVINVDGTTEPYENDTQLAKTTLIPSGGYFLTTDFLSEVDVFSTHGHFISLDYKITAEYVSDTLAYDMPMTKISCSSDAYTFSYSSSADVADIVLDNDNKISRIFWLKRAEYTKAHEASSIITAPVADSDYTHFIIAVQPAIEEVKNDKESSDIN